VRLARCLWRPTVQTALDQARATIRRLPQVRSSWPMPASGQSRSTGASSGGCRRSWSTIRVARRGASAAVWPERASGRDAPPRFGHPLWAGWSRRTPRSVSWSGSSLTRSRSARSLRATTGPRSPTTGWAARHRSRARGRRPHLSAALLP